MKNHEIKPGWYRSALRECGYKVRVHLVHEGHVYFTRLGMPHMSISTIECFRGIVLLPESE